MALKMTRAEFYKKYGEVEVTFRSYYKYVFVYEATLPDGSCLSVSYGGDSDTVYHHEASNTGKERVGSLQPFSGSVYKDSEEVEGFYD